MFWRLMTLSLFCECYARQCLVNAAPARFNFLPRIFWVWCWFFNRRCRCDWKYSKKKTFQSVGAWVVRRRVVCVFFIHTRMSPWGCFFIIIFRRIVRSSVSSVAGSGSGSDLDHESAQFTWWWEIFGVTFSRSFTLFSIVAIGCARNHVESRANCAAMFFCITDSPMRSHASSYVFVVQFVEFRVWFVGLLKRQRRSCRFNSRTFRMSTAVNNCNSGSLPVVGQSGPFQGISLALPFNNFTVLKTYPKYSSGSA